MEKILGKWKEEAYLLMRIMMGFMICCHGVQKLFGLFDGKGHAEGLWLAAGMIETSGGLLIIVGLFASNSNPPIREDTRSVRIIKLD